MASRSGLPDRFLPPDPRVEEPYRYTPQTAVRVAVLGIVALGVFAVLFLRLWALQVLSGTQYAEAATSNQQRPFNDEAPRGTILDRNGRILVTNVTANAVLLWPADLPKGDGRDTELRRLSAVLDVPFKRIVAQIKERRGDFLTPIKLQVALHRDQVAYLQEHNTEFPGITITRTYLRRYMAESLAAHVLGYTGQISPAELKRRSKEGLRGGDTVGLAGVEASKDSWLRGTPGTKHFTVDSLGRVRARASADDKLAVPGKAVRLTLDISLQRAAERALRYGIELAREDEHWAANGGAIVALDPNDGSILALASNPTYRPGIWVGKTDRKELAPLTEEKVAKERNYPGLNRVTAGLYPAGSTWKPVTALAALETPSLNITPYQTLECTPDYEASGQVFKNWDPYVDEPMDLPTAIAASCDTYFYQVGFRFYGSRQPGHPLQEWAARFGFGGRTGVDVGPEEAGLLPTPGWRKRTFTKETDPDGWEVDQLWKPGDSIQLAIGQKDLLVTPLQLARFYAMVANGGKLVNPHVVADVEEPGDAGASGVVLARFDPQPKQVIDDPGALEAVRKGLYEATHASYGTATGVFGSFPVAIAGKTGTAEKAVTLPGYVGLMDQSWFCGYGPVDNPRIVVCALIENGGHGGTAAAPATRRVFEHFFGVEGGGVGDVYSD